jgi:hypothetical protein
MQHRRLRATRDKGGKEGGCIRVHPGHGDGETASAASLSDVLDLAAGRVSPGEIDAPPNLDTTTSTAR